MEISSVLVRHAVLADRVAILKITEQTPHQLAPTLLMDALYAEQEVATSLVAIMEQRIVGHIMLAKSPVSFPDRVESAVTPAFISVTAGYRGMGIGSLLIQNSLQDCAEKGAHIAIVRGLPAYYPRFGFSPVLAQHLIAPHFGPDFMAKELESRALEGGPGYVQYPQAFQIGQQCPFECLAAV